MKLIIIILVLYNTFYYYTFRHTYHFILALNNFKNVYIDISFNKN